MKIYNLGQNVGVIIGFNMGYPGKPDEQKQLIQEFLQDIKYRYLIGITANYCQGESAKGLKDNEFRPVVTFYSSHPDKSQTLTLWVKTQDKFDDLSKEEITKNWPWNCSISFDRDDGRRIVITTIKENETNTDLKKLGFARIKNTPIYFKVDKEQIVKDK